MQSSAVIKHDSGSRAFTAVSLSVEKRKWRKKTHSKEDSNFRQAALRVSHMHGIKKREERAESVGKVLHPLASLAPRTTERAQVVRGMWVMSGCPI